MLALLSSAFRSHRAMSSLLAEVLPSSPQALACGGDDGIRTHDPLLAGQVLSQLSYTPMVFPLSLCSSFKELPSKLLKN